SALADDYRALNRTEDARKIEQEVLKYRQQLVEEGSDNPTSRKDPALIRMTVGDSLQQQKRLQEAREQYTVARDLLIALMLSNPANMTFPRELARAHNLI